MQTPWIELRVLREKDGHTLSSLARHSGVSLSYLSQLESGVRKPSVAVIAKLAQSLNVPKSMIEPRRDMDAA